MSDPGLLRDREFVRYLAARGLSGTGSMATYIALPVLVYRTSDDAGLTALVAALEAAPYLLFGLLAGALTDRWNRKRVMVAADLLGAAVLASIPLAAAVGEVTVPHILVVAFLGPTIGVFFDGAVFGAIPLLVGRGRIAEANSYAWSLQSAIEIVAPAVVGATLAVVDPAWLLGFDSLTFVLSAALLTRITRPMWDPERERAPLTAGLVVRDVREGLAFLVHHEGVRSMTVIGTLLMLSIGGYMALTVVWLDRVLHLGTEGWRFGITYMAWAVGGLAASVTIPRLVRFVSPGADRAGRGAGRRRAGGGHLPGHGLVGRGPAVRRLGGRDDPGRRQLDQLPPGGHARAPAGSGEHRRADAELGDRLDRRGVPERAAGGAAGAATHDAVLRLGVRARGGLRLGLAAASDRVRGARAARPAA